MFSATHIIFYQITSFGFYLDRSVVLAEPGYVDYEVYALNEPGYYTSPERDASNPSEISANAVDRYDYRGNLTAFTMIASGQIFEVNLEQGLNGDGFFQVPYGAFNNFNTSVPGSGGIRSFYIAKKSSAFLLSDPFADTTIRLNDEIPLLSGSIFGVYPPKVLVGEGVVAYPMGTTTYFYFAKSVSFFDRDK